MVRAAFVWHERYLGYYFGPEHPFNPQREKATLELLKRLKAFNSKAKIVSARAATETELRLVHTQGYIDFVKAKSKEGKGYLDYGDTPARQGIYEAACYRVGGSLIAADLAMQGIKAFNPAGGLHHAKPASAAGFCIFNDVAIAARYLQQNYKLKKIAIVDIDGHHGDSTQQIFYSEPILTISLHRYSPFFYPGTGSAEEKGQGAGKGFNINIPLEAGTGDKVYLKKFNEAVPRALTKYKPEAIIAQFGVDAYKDDSLVGLGLTAKAYKAIAEKLCNLTKQLSSKLLVLGGGGYSKAVPRLWALIFLILADEFDLKKVSHQQLFV